MACTDPATTAAADALEASLAGGGMGGISSVTVDGNTTTMFPLADLIAADKYLLAKCAANNRTRGLRFNRLVPDGAVQRRPYGPGCCGSGWGRGGC